MKHHHPKKASIRRGGVGLPVFFNQRCKVLYFACVKGSIERTTSQSGGCVSLKFQVAVFQKQLLGIPILRPFHTLSTRLLSHSLLKLSNSREVIQ